MGASTGAGAGTGGLVLTLLPLLVVHESHSDRAIEEVVVDTDADADDAAVPALSLIVVVSTTSSDWT